MKRTIMALTLLTFMMGASLGHGGQVTNRVVVNGKTLKREHLQAIKKIFHLPQDAVIPGGNYWYDPVSGLWGKTGGPALGQILPNLDLGGGRLKADASKSKTGVFINGRQVHSQELAYLKRVFGYVNPGRYWLSYRGIGGYEGGPAQFDLSKSVSSSGSGQGGYSGYTRRTPFGSIGGDSNCSYYLHPGGSSVLTCP